MSNLNLDINHLQLAECTARWQGKSIKELQELREEIQRKMAATKNSSRTVYLSLENTHKHLEHYIKIREAQAQIAKQYKDNGNAD